MFYFEKKVLVTGGTGFIGSHLVEALLNKGASVRVPVHHRPLRAGKGKLEELPADLYSYQDCLKVVEGIDYIFHAAGAVGSAGISPSAQMELITQNGLLAGNILRAAWDANTERILMYGSSTGYPDLHHPVREEEMWDGSPHPAYLGYGWMRRYIEKMAEFVVTRSSLKVAIVRPTAVYGEWDDSDHVIPSLIRRALSRENPFVLWGDGSEVRDFLHASDLATGSLLLLEHHAECDPVNIGYGATCTVADALDCILRSTGHTDCQIACDTSRPTTIPYRAVDTAKAFRLLGFSPSITLQEGIDRAVAYYRRAAQ